jgi:DDE family transposase
VDDWYQAQGSQLLAGKAGQKPVFRDSEAITLVLAQDFIPYPAETQYMEFIRANYLPLFPKLVNQSQFNRRARALRLMLEELRRHWINQKGWHLHTHYWLDTQPVPVLGYKRYKNHSDFAGHAEYGCCAGRNLQYFGYKLVVLSTLDGLPIVYELVPANLDERLAAKAVVDYLGNCHIFADKGFLGAEWQACIFDQTQNRIWTPKRQNQFIQNSKDFDRWLSAIRERIEGVFHEIQNTGRNLERLLAKTVSALCTRIIAKMTSHLLRHLLRIDFHVNVQTFSLPF